VGARPRGKIGREHCRIPKSPKTNDGNSAAGGVLDKASEKHGEHVLLYGMREETDKKTCPCDAAQDKPKPWQMSSGCLAIVEGSEQHFIDVGDGGDAGPSPEYSAASLGGDREALPRTMRITG